MESLLEILLSALETVLKPSAIILRNDHSTRLMEGLTQYVKPVYGQAPEKCLLEENEVSFKINPLTGQKTGWFYDHPRKSSTITTLRFRQKSFRCLQLCGWMGSASSGFRRRRSLGHR